MSAGLYGGQQQNAGLNNNPGGGGGGYMGGLPVGLQHQDSFQSSSNGIVGGGGGGGHGAVGGAGDLLGGGLDHMGGASALGGTIGAASVADFSMLDASGGLNGNVFDMDMSLPMELDVDMQQGGAVDGTGAGTFGPGGMQQDGMVGDAVAASVNGEATTHSARPPEMTMTGVGAGPLPTGFGMQVGGSGSGGTTSTLTEFTKRRNWSQRVIEEIKDFLHILTPDGRILWVSPSCKAITGYESPMLIGKFIGEYVHPDDSGIFMREFNESIASGNALRFFYRFKKDDGTYMIFECDGHPHISNAEQAGALPPQGYNASPNAGNIAGMCRGFFMMARPYPTKIAALLDSFLEHKIENERLMKRIEELKREEAEENAEQDRLIQGHHAASAASLTRATPSESQGPSGGGAQDAVSEGPGMATPNYQGMPPPAKPPISNTALTQQNLTSALSSQKPDSIADKMSRYEANSTHLESIELLTGLRYRDGERSHGISTGDTSPALIRGDAGIAILLDRDREGNKKEKKKLKVADEYVCADCGTLDSPEWRKGPKGPKTLCNACGLRWAKKEKKRGGDGSPSGATPTSAHMAGVPQLQQQGSGSGSGMMGGSGGGGMMGVAGSSMSGNPPSLPMERSSGSA